MIPVYIFNGRRQTLVNTIGILPALRMRGLHDKRHLLAKLRICDSENYKYDFNILLCVCLYHILCLCAHRCVFVFL